MVSAGDEGEERRQPLGDKIEDGVGHFITLLPSISAPLAFDGKRGD
jgi:hypothetical protein